MRIPVHTQTEEVAGGRSATSAQPPRATLVLAPQIFLLTRATSHPLGPRHSEQPARFWRASVATRFPPAPRSRKRFVGKPITETEEFTMIANALLFTIVILLGYGFWLLDQLKFMARYKAVLYHAYGTTILIFLAVLFREPVWRCARHQPPLLPQEYRAQTLAPRQAVQRQPCGHARSRERGGFQLVSRDAFSHDPQDTWTRATRPRAAPSASTDQHLPIRETAGIQRRRPLAVAIAPRLANSIPPATNAAIPRAPITSATAPISSAIPRCTP